MTPQGDEVHYLPLSPPELVTHTDKRDSCFHPDPDDPVFFEIISITCLSIFPINFHYVKTALNCPPRL